MSGCLKCYGKVPCFKKGDKVMVWKQTGEYGLCMSLIGGTRKYHSGEMEYWCYLVSDGKIDFWLSCNEVPRIDVHIDELAEL